MPTTTSSFAPHPAHASDRTIAYQQPVKDVVAALNSDTARGLTSLVASSVLRLRKLSKMIKRSSQPSR